MSTSLVLAVLGIVGSLVTFGIQLYWRRTSKEAQQADQEKKDKTDQEQAVEGQQRETGSVNDSIDAQRQAAKDWLKGKGGTPPL